MAVKLSPEQQRNAQILNEELDAANASPRVRQSAFEAAWVESRLKNLRGGDRDSEGVFQQRPSQGWGTPAQVTNVRHASRSYIQKAIAANTGGGSSGQLAQHVQVSAYPGRYDAAKTIARDIMAQVGGSSASPRGSSKGGVGLAADLSRPDSVLAQDSGLASPLTIAVPQQPAVTPPVAPNAPEVAMPGAYPGAPQAGSPASLAPQQIEQPAAPDMSTDFSSPQAGQDAAQGASSSPGSTSSSGQAGVGKVVIASGANKAGQPLQKPVLGVLQTLAGVLPHGTLTVGTGTNHSRYVAGTTRVSDHAAGNAADVPAVGKQLTSDATTALLTFAEGKTVQWLRNDGSVAKIKITASNAHTIAAAGGIWNVEHDGGRLQLIANTHQGGDHTNHLHVGFKR